MRGTVKGVARGRGARGGRRRDQSPQTDSADARACVVFLGGGVERVSLYLCFSVSPDTRGGDAPSVVSNRARLGASIGDASNERPRGGAPDWTGGAALAGGGTGERARGSNNALRKEDEGVRRRETGALFGVGTQMLLVFAGIKGERRVVVPGGLLLCGAEGERCGFAGGRQRMTKCSEGAPFRPLERTLRPRPTKAKSPPRHPDPVPHRQPRRVSGFDGRRLFTQ
jgi:hypothetical protein